MEILGHGVTFISRPEVGDALTNATLIFETIDKNRGIFTAITDNDITEMTDSINKYKTGWTKTDLEKAEKTGFGTALLPGELKKGMECIANFYDMIYGFYYKTDYGLVSAFKTAKRIKNEGIRHTTLMVKVCDAGDLKKMIEGATVELVDLGKKLTTDKRGNAVSKKNKCGVCTIRVIAKGYEIYEEDLELKRGKKLKVVVKLVKK